MKITTTFLSIFLFANLLIAQTPGRVLVIGIDGCRADALRQANTPNIHGLLDHAVFSFDALTQFPTWSGPGWSSMCTGVWSDKHGVLDNTFAGANYVQYPHFIQRKEEQDPSTHSASIVHWSPINTEINSLCDIEINVATDLEVKSSAVTYLTDNDPDILFLDFDDVDHAGHTYGFDPSIPEYMASIELTDAYVGEILAALQARPNFIEENWLVLVTPDHGGNLQGHGGASFEERNIFFIAWKPDLAPHEITKDSTVFSLQNGLEFNGTDQYLLPDDSSPFEFGADQDFSIEMRVRYDSLTGDAAFISNKDWDSGLNTGWVLSTPFGDQTHWKVNIADGSTRADVTGGFIADGNWHHLAVTFDRDGMMNLYEDSNAIGQADISAIGNVDAGFPVVLGQDGTFNYPFFFSGSMAEVRIWDTVLSPETVAAYTCAPLDATHPDASHLLAYWKMDDGTGSTIANSVSGSPAAVLQGAPANWTPQPGNLICYNFANTPRIVDIAVTALEHLCVDIDPAWNLDGHSLVEGCLASATHELSNTEEQLEIAPNPATNTILLAIPSGLGQVASLDFYNQQGQLVQRMELHLAEGRNELTMNIEHWQAGAYYVMVSGEEGSPVYGRFVKMGE